MPQHLFRWSLARKITLAMTLLVVISILLVTLLSIRREQQTIREELENRAILMLDMLDATLADSMYNGDVSPVGQVMGEIGLGHVSSVVSGEVYDADGRIIADIEQGTVYFLAVDPFGESLLDQEETLFRWEDNELVAGRAVILGNQRLGAISIGLSTQPLENKVNQIRTQGLLLAGGSALIGMALSLLLSRSITEPLRELTAATEHITQGDLSREITIHTNDELETLAKSFNLMTARLRENIQSLEHRAIELQEANSKILEASRLKSDFMATMSHELRTPLNAIMGYSQLQLSGLAGALTEKQHFQLDRILKNGEQLLNLINDILDLSKVEAGRLELVPHPFELRPFITDILSQIQPLASEKNLSLNSTIDPNLPEKLMADDSRIKQIIINLLSNAIKFTDTGSVMIDLQQREKYWSIAVTDTGIGIPSHAQEFIFDEFRQVDGSSTRKQGGTGLGLAIVRKLAYLMGGTVTVKSIVGEGSTFTVLLPLIAVEQNKATA